MTADDLPEAQFVDRLLLTNGSSLVSIESLWCLYFFLRILDTLRKE